MLVLREHYEISYICRKTILIVLYADINERSAMHTLMCTQFFFLMLIIDKKCFNVNPS